MAVRPDRRVQHDDGASLARLEARLAAVVGSAVGGLIAEENTIDDPFCRMLAAATDECAGAAEQCVPRSSRNSYRFQIVGATYAWHPHGRYLSDEPVTVAVALYDDGEVAAAWRHPAPYVERGYRSVQARTADGFRLVDYADAYPLIADTARRLLTELRDAWHAYRDAQTDAYMKAEIR